MTGVLQEMKETLHLEEVLVDDHHLTTEVLKYQEEGELVNRLMEILEMMDHQIIEDILQGEDHQEADPQEEDHLVLLAHLEMLDPQEIEDLQVPLDHKDTEDPLDHKDLWDHRGHLDKLLDNPICLEMSLHQVKMGTSGLERTFLGMVNAVERLAQQQIVSNEQLNESVREQRREREEGKQVLLDIAHASIKILINISLLPYLIMMALVEM